MTPLSRLRRLWLDVHLWIGAGLAVLLIPLSVSGAILVWHDAIDHAVYAERYAISGPAASQPVEAYAAAATQAFGGQAVLTQLRLPQKPGDPVVAVGRIKGAVPEGGRPRTLNAWIDPPTAKVLATAELASTGPMVLHRLHGSLLIPDIGRKTVGWLGWAMLVSSATGLWLWWPRHGGVSRGLRWHRGGSTLFNLHHQVGFWLCLPLAVLSLTGLSISFPQTSHALVGAPPPPARGGPGRNAPPIERPQLTVAQAAAIASQEARGAPIASLSTPTRGKEPAWRVEFKGAPAMRILDSSGVAKLSPPGGGAQDPTSRWMRRIHDGGDMGVAWRLIITVAGVAPAILGVTGVILWLRRRRRRLAITRERELTPAAAE